MTASYETQSFFDETTWTITYVISDPTTGDAIVIDPVLDYDPVAAATETKSVEKVVAYVRKKGLTVRASLETHAHADHLSAGQYLGKVLGAKVGIGSDITLVQATFRPIFNLPASTKIDGSQFDLLLRAGESYSFGSVVVVPIATPGHTPACQSFLIGDAVYTGDALFIEDYGTGRTDFPAGSAETLYHSVHHVLYNLPLNTRVYVGHDYLPGGRALRTETTIEKERAANVQLRAETTREEFVSFRKGRDRELQAPRLLFPSVLVNVFGGRLPEPEENGQRYLKIPLNLRKKTDDAGVPVPTEALS